MSNGTPLLNLTDEKPHEAIGIAMGRVSVCWDNIKDAGIFQSEKAADVVNELSEYLRQRIIQHTANLEGLMAAVVKCPHRTGLCYYDGKMLSLLPCDCNEKSEILEVHLLRSKLPEGASLIQVEEWLGRDD